MKNQRSFFLIVLLAVSAGCGQQTEAPPSALAPPAEEILVNALAHYEGIRGSLAKDDQTTLRTQADALAGTLRGGAALQDSPVAALFAEGAQAAEALGSAPDLKAARDVFSPLSKALVTLTAAVPRLEKAHYLFECPMVDGFNLWIQTNPDIDNPYMGTKMLRCGSQVSWEIAPELSAAARRSAAQQSTATQEHTEADHASIVPGGEIAFYTCPMHPSIRQSEAGTCPICSMDLTPVTQEEVQSGILRVDGTRRQLIGLRTERVQRREARVSLRTVGSIAIDETRVTDITLKYDAWIENLFADETGEHVSHGKTLLTLYSPELYSAQQEYIAALAGARRAKQTGAPDRADYMVDAAKRRLQLWDLGPIQIGAIAERGEPLRYLPILSPVTGHVLEKNVVEGAFVKAGERLLRIATLDRVWVEAELYETDLPLVSVGQQVEISFPNLGSEPLPGTVAFIMPVLDAKTRTGRVRIEVDNPGFSLKPQMFADVTVTLTRGERLIVPEEAVVFAGERRVVFLDIGEGRLRPQRVEIGPRTDAGYEVLAGLREGDLVVTSGNFLVSAESRLKSAMEQW